MKIFFFPGAVSDPSHQKEYASALLQGIASFSSASKVKLWAVHIVSLKPETTKLFVEVCQSFCSTPNSQRRRQDSHRGRRDKKPNEEKTYPTRKTQSLLLPIPNSLIRGKHSAKANKTSIHFSKPSLLIHQGLCKKRNQLLVMAIW